MNSFLHVFEYGFLLRGLEAGIIVALIAPLIGIFLVLRRYSLIADTLAHVSLAGIAVGLLFGFPPALVALVVTVLSSLSIEKLRMSRKVYGESALSIFLSGSLALAVVILSFARGFNSSLFSYLFGSIVTVSSSDVWVILSLAVVVFLTVVLFYKELVYSTFDEESAKASGVPVQLVNTILIVLSALTVSLAIPIVGVLLVSAQIVLPVVTALRFGKSFLWTIIIAEICSVSSVFVGVLVSFYFDLSVGGTIVLVMLALLGLVWGIKKN